MVKYATEDVTSTPTQDNSDVDKVENGYANMPNTPKATDVMPILAEKRTGMYRFAVQSVHLRECFAEFLGTFVMIVFGMGVNNQVTNSENANGTWLSINICWGIGVMIGVYCSEGISGANLNTAVTLAHCVIYAITDQKNRPAGKYGNAFAFALMIMALGMAFGMNTGYAVNPARDFGPRLFTLCAGWGSKVFTSHHYYFWIPIVSDLLGGVAGAGLYRILVEIHHPQTPLP
ncbi:hypothetical protein JG688_00017379 [Phytophthora aleatoria]|uniref:Aquaporin n=1 Tax=Phytophthora aleatoria TaxID=2496075 RepID=A0A8J5MBT1_9STRA|nr:hypothetical protein JG688_00017379 [Phytophthora aleatoria]